MNVICNEYNIETEKLVIQHNIITNEYSYSLIHRPTGKITFTSEPISDLIAARAKGFQHVGVQV